jgi:hypothetical protein
MWKILWQFQPRNWTWRHKLPCASLLLYVATMVLFWVRPPWPPPAVQLLVDSAITALYVVSCFLVMRRPRLKISWGEKRHVGGMDPKRTLWREVQMFVVEEPRLPVRSARIRPGRLCSLPFRAIVVMESAENRRGFHAIVRAACACGRRPEPWPGVVPEFQDLARNVGVLY